MVSIRLTHTITNTPSRYRFPNSSSCSSRTNSNFGNFGDYREKSLYRDHKSNEQKPRVPLKVAMVTSERLIVSEPKTDFGDMISLIIRRFVDMVLMWLKMAIKIKPWKLNPQMLMERAIVDCRFFTLFAVGGSLLGSVLCFLEGCFLVIESYIQYFHALAEKSSDLGHVMELLIETIDMFLIGTAMLTIGMGLHVMFVGAKHLETKGSTLPPSNFFGLFYLKALPEWAKMGSVAQAKSKMGHAVMMIMQVSLVEKFKGIPIVTGLDLACFAGAVFVSSISIFLLSRLSIKSDTISISTKLTL